MDSPCTSSLRYVIATAGKPASVTPSNARRRRNDDQFGAMTVSSTSTEEPSNDASMLGLRPTATEIAPANSIATAMTPVVSDNDKLLLVASTLNARENAGISGCTQYNRPNVAKPDENKARLVRRNAGVPWRMRRSTTAASVAEDEPSTGNLQGMSQWRKATP